MGATIVGRRESTKALLACRVPNCGFNAFGCDVHHDNLRLEGIHVVVAVGRNALTETLGACVRLSYSKLPSHFEVNSNGALLHFFKNSVLEA